MLRTRARPFLRRCMYTNTVQHHWQVNLHSILQTKDLTVKLASSSSIILYHHLCEHSKMLFPTLVLFTLLVTPCTAQFWSVFTKLKPGAKPIPERPNIDLPAPNNNKPKIDTQPVKPPQEQAQANNLAGLKQKVDHIQDIIEYFDAGKDIVDAILGTQSTTIKGESEQLLHNQQVDNAQSLIPQNSSIDHNHQPDCHRPMPKLRFLALFLRIRHSLLLLAPIQCASLLCVLPAEHQHSSVSGHANFQCKLQHL